MIYITNYHKKRILKNKMSVKVVTYNILSEYLCNDKTFKSPHYEPKYLDNDYRYNKLKDVLNSYIMESYIICLQEVTKDMSCKLQLYFSKHAYEFYFDSYGDYYNGYMGVSIAMPWMKKVIRVEKYRLSDGKPWPKEDLRSDLRLSFLSWISLGYLDFNPKSKRVWCKARNKRNTILSIEFEHETFGRYTVSTVHMPCAFRDPSIMMTYIALARQAAKKFADGNPYVLAGDFNITPQDKLYECLCNRVFNTDILREDFNPLDDWSPNGLDLDRLHSAHFSIHGHEPAYTCYAINQAVNANIEFKNTVDFLLYNEGFNVESADCVISSSDPMPNKYEQSDHLPVSAVFHRKEY